MKEKIEKINWQDYGFKLVAGVDEVGRGCLAGPVYAAAAIVDEKFNLSGITDSKLIRPDKRETLSEQIKSQAVAWAVGIATVTEINQINILKASLLAMKRAVETLNVPPEMVIVDGNQKIPDLKFKQETLIKGDLRCLPISCASIIAKVARDQYMEQLESLYPGYEWAVHKGYGTPKHLAHIKNLGPTEVHRASFRGVREYILGAGR